jgi:hypothetical protein
MNTVHDVFNALGGNAAVARALGVIPSTASEMKRRESIPVEYWPKLVEHARNVGKEEITLERLAIILAEAGSRRRQAATAQ